eukprot:9456077-Pyramimonas_sp.AAC.1
MRRMTRRCSSRRRAAPISSAQARTTPRSLRQMDLSKLDMNGPADSANRQPELGQPCMMALHIHKRSARSAPTAPKQQTPEKRNSVNFTSGIGSNMPLRTFSTQL